MTTQIHDSNLEFSSGHQWPLCCLQCQLWQARHVHVWLICRWFLHLSQVWCSLALSGRSTARSFITSLISLSKPPEDSSSLGVQACSLAVAISSSQVPQSPWTVCPQLWFLELVGQLTFLIAGYMAHYHVTLSIVTGIGNDGCLTIMAVTTIATGLPLHMHTTSPQLVLSWVADLMLVWEPWSITRSWHFIATFLVITAGIFCRFYCSFNL